MAKSKNIYVIDTCVLLHDPDCIYKFEEHDIYIPLACIDDLDEIKTRKDNSAWAAREVFRNLDKYDILQVTKGITINEKGGKLFIYNHESLPARGEKPSIVRVNSDNAIIDTAHLLISSFPKRKVVIVSKDTGLRVRANTWGCLAENYKNDLLEGELFSGYRTVLVDDLSDWEYLNKRNGLNINVLKCKSQLCDLLPNEFVIFKFGEQSVFAWHRNGNLDYLEEKKRKDSYMGVSAKNMEQRFALEALNDDNIPLVCLSGPAGSGKSLLTLAVALEKINLGVYDRIIVMKPLIPVGGKDIGFLPGSKLEKVSAWLGPIKDNLIQLTNSSGYSTKNEGKFGGLCFEEMVEDGIIEVEAMTFIQGRSIPNAFIMLDECLTGDSLIYLSDGSVKTIESIQDGEKVISFNTETQTWSENYIKSKFTRTTDEIITIHTSRNILKCTPTHKMWVYENGEKLVKKSAENITLSDMIPINNSFTHIVTNDVSEEEAGLAALILTDGHIEKNLHCMKIDMSKDQDWLEKTFLQFCKNSFSSFNSNCKNSRNNKICKIYRKSEIEKFCNKFQLKSGKKANSIKVPDLIWNAPIESVKKFIQICFDAEGDVHYQEKENMAPQIVINFCSTSLTFAQQIQALLLKFSIDSHLYFEEKDDVKYATCYKISIVGGFWCQKFFENIKFSLERKQNYHNLIKNVNFSCPIMYPKLIGLDIYNSLEEGGRWKPKDKCYRGTMNDEINDRINRRHGSYIREPYLQKIQSFAEKYNLSINNIVSCCKINNISRQPEVCDVYDFEVENDHTFVVNGIVSSNCENVSPKEARMVVERCGKGSKVVLLGDLSQIENPYLDKHSCGLAHAVNGGKIHDVAASINMTKVERSILAAAASKIFKK
jgi:PhoH-like ATPase